MTNIMSSIHSNNTPIMERCIAITQKGQRCKIYALDGKKRLCHCHTRIYNQGRFVKTIHNSPINPKAVTQMPVTIINNYKVTLNPTIDATVDTIVNTTADRMADAIVDTELQIIDQQHELDNVPFIVEGNYDCQCCYNNLPFCELIKCSNTCEKYKHVICKECVLNYVNAGLSEKKANINCMIGVDGCGGSYSMDDIKLCLPENILNNLCDLVDVGTVMSLSKVLYNYHICPFCSKFGCEISTNIKTIECGRCVKHWCVKCRKTDHGNDPCGKIKDPKDVDGIRRIVQETITDALTHECPSCKTKYIKETGCNLMTCPSCHTLSCYVCGIIIIPVKIGTQTIKYQHFKGAGSAAATATCLLYNDGNGVEKNQGNTSFNNEKVLKKCQELININDMKSVKNVIKDEMKRCGIKSSSECVIL